MHDRVNVHQCSLYLSGQAWKEAKGEKFILEAVSSLVYEGEWVSDSSFSGSKDKNSRVVFWMQDSVPSLPAVLPTPKEQEQPALQKILEEISSHNWALGCCCTLWMSLTPPAVCLAETHKSHGIFLYNSQRFSHCCLL